MTGGAESEPVQEEQAAADSAEQRQSPPVNKPGSAQPAFMRSLRAAMPWTQLGAVGSIVGGVAAVIGLWNLSQGADDEVLPAPTDQVEEAFVSTTVQTTMPTSTAPSASDVTDPSDLEPSPRTIDPQAYYSTDGGAPAKAHPDNGTCLLGICFGDSLAVVTAGIGAADGEDPRSDTKTWELPGVQLLIRGDDVVEGIAVFWDDPASFRTDVPWLSPPELPTTYPELVDVRRPPLSMFTNFTGQFYVVLPLDAPKDRLGTAKVMVAGDQPDGEELDPVAAGEAVSDTLIRGLAIDNAESELDWAPRFRISD